MSLKLHIRNASLSDKVLSMSNEIINIVQTAYDAKAVAQADASPERVEYAKKVALAFGYTENQLHSIPSDSNMGLSCGNPIASATIKEGEKVLDLGSGGGIDVFLAAHKVGLTGQVIGLDMSPEMIARSRSLASNKKLFPPHVNFVQAQLTQAFPIASNSVDCILSNCVINLLPPDGKEGIFAEAFRVLKPGGRIVLNDIIARKILSDRIQNDMKKYVGCISGAILLEKYQQLLESAGFKGTTFVEKKADLNIYTSDSTIEASAASQPSCCSAKIDDGELSSFDANEWVASYDIYAIKPEDCKTEAHPRGHSALLRWWDAFPVGKSSPAQISVKEVASFVKQPKEQDYVVIDVRGDDHAGGHVRGSFQHPAQSFYIDLSSIYQRYSEVYQVVFYCQSSSGRGPRCASWYQDYLNEMDNTKSKVYVMAGGIKAWLKMFGTDEDLVEYDKE